MSTLSELEVQARDLKNADRYSEAFAVRLRLEQLHVEGNSPVRDQIGNLNWLAYLGVHTGNLADAERAARKCLDLYRAVAGAADEKLATYTMMLSAVLAEAGKFSEAARTGDVAVELFVASGHDAEFVQQRRADVTRMRRGEPTRYLDRF
jgi:hypothetical protein